MWRQASRLCHPDLVADEFKEKAHQLMVQLNQARQRGDFPAIHALLESLKQGLEPLMASTVDASLTCRSRILSVLDNTFSCSVNH
ncbi:Uncharacterised protein [Yersinia enterocolitica]|nr:Uncharacterised protein [Yersinia enterocolitica]CNC94441.1 Uncharacterised protein [Yersinia enterocolitica]CND34650.1 Uncharacterised protein [Yersinia enterocolitica]CNE38439.1 Uncharacterised protein [Yersinia enterocolitica]CNF65742.1 Uncharacterised protein [Yersinia enterocolitica]